MRPLLPDYGCLPRWPQDGDSFIHPEDIQVAIQCIPSERVLRRDEFDGTWYRYHYGDASFRLQPVMWLPVRYEGIDMGDQVEIRGAGMERELFVAHVNGMHFVRRKGRIAYRLRRGDRTVPRLYLRDEFRSLTDKTQINDADVSFPPPRWVGDTTKVESDWLDQDSGQP